MKFFFADNITEYLIAGIEKQYRLGISDIVKKAKKKFSVKFAIEIDYSRVDQEAIRAFKREAFLVGKIGSYECQEKLRKLAAEIWEKHGQDFDEFEKRARNIMLDYIPLNEQMPSGWLKHSYNTAVNTSYRAAEYNRLQQYKAIYPAYEYKTQADDHVRPEHEELDGLILKADDPMWDTIWPPNDWNCRCWVDPIDSDEFDPNELAEIDEKERLNLENNVAPDFQRNAGQEQSIWGDWLPDKINGLPDEVKDQIKDDLVEYNKSLK